MNNDLISREALKKAIQADIDIGDNVCDIGYLNAMYMCIEYIDNAPTVEITETEVQEVLNKRCMTAVANEYLIALHGKRQQGEWIMNKTSARGRNYTCTNCQKVSRNKSEFCPKCGTKMKGGAE